MSPGSSKEMWKCFNLKMKIAKSRSFLRSTPNRKDLTVAQKLVVDQHTREGYRSNTRPQDNGNSTRSHSDVSGAKMPQV